MSLIHDFTGLANLRSAGRLHWLLAVYVALSITVYGRLVAIELRDGADYRAVAAEPIIRKHTVAGMRGRILARDGSVLAYDQPVVSVAVQYRWLQDPPDERWLRRMARARLSSTERRDKRKLAHATEEVLDQRAEVARRLQSLCGLSEAQWESRAERIARRVTSISAGVNARHDAINESARWAAENRDIAEDSLPQLVGRSVAEALFALDDPPVPQPITVAEEVTPHVIYTGLSLEAVAEIEAHPERYPGVELTHSYRRCYPSGELAAHILGYLGVVNDSELALSKSTGTQKDTDPDSYESEDWVGRAGIERQYESTLRGRRGLIEDRIDVRGNVKASITVSQPAGGQDLVLTIDPALQRTAEALADQALARRLPSRDEKVDRASGSAVAVLDVHTGAVLAAAAAPRFDPNAFVKRESTQVQQYLSDPARPLFNRVVQMALPPGSVFKMVSAAAVLDAGVDWRLPVECQGYLYQPDSLRCDIFRQLGIGHGPVTLIDALARSCNVYFFYQAQQLGIDPFVDWAGRFGLGQPTGIDLPAEARGRIKPTVPSKDATNNPERVAEARLMAIGQGPVTATPLQIARVAAAFANDGTLVTPHVAQSIALVSNDSPEDTVLGHAQSDPIDIAPPHAVAGLTARILSPISKGLRQVVADEQGTAHATVDLADVAIAGKTGTAETGAGRPSHSWFVGYAPAQQPQVAFVVTIEHAGSAATSAGPVARTLVQRIAELGYFRRLPSGEATASSTAK